MQCASDKVVYTEGSDRYDPSARPIPPHPRKDLVFYKNSILLFHFFFSIISDFINTFAHLSMDIWNTWLVPKRNFSGSLRFQIEEDQRLKKTNSTCGTLGTGHEYETGTTVYFMPGSFSPSVTWAEIVANDDWKIEKSSSGTYKKFQKFRILLKELISI